MYFTSLIAQAADSSEMFNSTSPATQTTNVAMFIGITLFVITIMIATYAVGAFFLGRIFKKAGVESWKAWVPVYNLWTMLELGAQPGWWAVLALVPLVNIAAAIFQYIAMYRIGLRFGKEGWFVALAIFVPIVWLAWLALDQSTWKTESGDSLPPSSPSDTPAWTPPVGS